MNRACRGTWTFLKNKLDWLIQVSYVTVNVFLKTEMQNHAAAAAYYFLLSAIPLILVLFFAFNSVLAGYPELYKQFYSLFSYIDRMLDLHLLKDMDKSSGMGKLAGGVSILTLVWSSKGLLYSVQNSFGIIFPDYGKRGAISAGIISLSIVPLAIVVVALSLSGDYMTMHWDRYLPDNLLLADMLTGAFHAVKFLFPFLLVWHVVFSAYYRITPKKPQFSLTLASSALCTLSFLALKLLLIDNAQIAQYNVKYGAIGNIVFVLICVYSFFIVFFLWAQFLYSAGKIDVIALEKIFIESAEQNTFMGKVEAFLFKRSARIFEKYGKPCRAGEAIIHQGDKSSTIYYLYTGQLGFYREHDGGRNRVGILNCGEIFGEMAYFLNEARTATVVAESDCFLFIISPEMFEVLLRDSPCLSRKIIALLCQRIYRSTPQTAAARKEEIEPAGNARAYGMPAYAS